MLVLVFQAKAVYIRFYSQQNVLHYIPQRKTISTVLPAILRLFIKNGSSDEEQAVFEQLTLSDFKKWNSTALKADPQVRDNFWQLKVL